MGALILVGLDILGWSVEECISNFEAFSSQAFQPWFPRIPHCLRNTKIISGVLKALSLLFTFLMDSKYSADGLEKLLRDICGPQRALIGFSEEARTESYLGITLNNVRTGTTVLATSYNGVGSRPESCGQSLSRYLEIHHY